MTLMTSFHEFVSETSDWYMLNWEWEEKRVKGIYFQERKRKMVCR